MSHDPARALRAIVDWSASEGETALDQPGIDLDDLRAVLDELDRLRAPVPKIPIRGVDFVCEQCGGLHGSKLENGWYRCKGCGYPGQ